MPLIPLKIFLCHASADKKQVRNIYHRLIKNGFLPWLDEESLLPGQAWQLEIPKAVHSSDIVLVCLSNNSLTKSGYVQKEIKFALDIAYEKPEGTIFLIPLKLENCQVPENLSAWQWVNYFEENGHDKLLRALQARAEDLGLLIPKVHIDFHCSPWADEPGSEIATKFVPTCYPQKLMKARLYISKSGTPWTEFEIRVYDEKDSLPGCRLDSGNVRASGNIGNEWIEIDLSQQNIIVNSGAFFVSMYWLTPPGDQGRNAQFLSAKYTKGQMPERTYFKWPRDGKWFAQNDRCCFFEVIYDSGIVQKSYQ